jgi:hypothetical protein
MRIAHHFSGGNGDPQQKPVPSGRLKKTKLCGEFIVILKAPELYGIMNLNNSFPMLFSGYCWLTGHIHVSVPVIHPEM